MTDRTRDPNPPALRPATAAEQATTAGGIRFAPGVTPFPWPPRPRHPWCPRPLTGPIRYLLPR